MAEGGIAAALAGPEMGPAVQTAGNRDEQPQGASSIVPPPSNMSGMPAWGMSIGIGKSLSESLLENFPELAGTEEEKEALTSLMQSMMNQVTKSLAESLDYLKELDDDEEKCAATTIYNQ
jgi:hypothetical protein